MKTFEYKGFDPRGSRVRGLIEADDPSQAREKLAARGILSETVAAVTAPGARASRRAARFDRLAERAAFYRELGSMLRAGLPVIQSLDLLLEAPEMGAARSAVAGIRDRIREGVSPADALSETGQVTPFERAAIEAGGRVGALGASLDQVATYLEEQIRTRDRIVSALIYPVVVGVLALVVAIVMFTFMLPAFASMWEEARIPLPPLTRGVMAAGRWGSILLLVGAFGAAGAWLALGSRREARARARAWGERMLLRLPVLGPTRMALLSMRFARTLSLLLRGGVPLLEALRLAGEATGSRALAVRVEEEAESVRHGGRLADALRRIGPLAGSLPGWVQAGEAGGELAPMLDAAADRCRDRWERSLARALAVLEPALIIVLGGMVLVLALAILLPVFSLNQSLR